MAKLFRIVIKGEREPLFLTYSQGMKLKDDLENNRLEGMISIDDALISVGSIKAILPDSEPNEVRQASFSEMMEKVNKEWNDWKKTRLAMTPKERAENTSFMNMMSQAIRGRKLSEEEKKDVQVCQQQWFEQHPDFYQANPICYFKAEEISRIEKRRLNRPFEMKELLATNMLQFAERHLNS